MTCIVGLEQNGKAFMGGDSASGADNTVRVVLTEKIFRKGQFIIGYTSSFRMGQILHYCVDFPASAVYDESYMVGQFVEAVRKKFKDFGFSKIESNEETGGSFLVGVDGKIWQVESDFQVSRPSDGMSAIGCGSDFALGALKALDKLPPEERLLNALTISAYYCAWVRPPFTVLESTRKGK